MARVSFAAVKRVGIALGWILLFAVVGFGITIGISKVVPGWGGASWQLFRNVAYSLVGFLAATLIVGKLLAKESWDRLGWRGGRRGLGVSFPRGVLLGVLMAALAIGLALILDRSTVTATHDWSRWPGVALPLAVSLLCAALAEELAFRGFPLQRLSDAIGRVAAVAVLAVLFAAGHAWNPNATGFGTVNVALAAVWLSIAFFSAGGMGLAWGLHFGWNAGLALLFDAPVSGYGFSVPAVEYAPGAHAWVDGGAFGPEGGLVATVAIAAGTLYLIRGRLRPARVEVPA